ncbi:MAG: DUF2019 domain-containing protein [Rhodospirillaceae bacterium]|nr:DUF2019 domain-containing protein [Rhodospirillaceae bacterium]
MTWFSWRKPKSSVDQLVDELVRAGKKVPDLVGPTEISAYDAADRAMRKIAEAIKALGPEGEAALMKLMDHKIPVVRVRAAGACMSFARDRAVNVLADVCELRAGQVSMDAMHVLLFAGEFDMKTGPKRRPV